MLHHGRIDLCWFLPVLLGRFRDRLRLDSLPIHLIDPAADRIQRGNAALGQREDSPGRRPGQLRQLVDAPDELFLTLATVSRSFASRISC